MRFENEPHGHPEQKMRAERAEQKEQKIENPEMEQKIQKGSGYHIF